MKYEYPRPRARKASRITAGALTALTFCCLTTILAARFRPPRTPATATATAAVTDASPIPTASPTISPTPTVADTPGPSPTPTERTAFQYTIVEGDTLFSIALANGLTVRQLAEANGKVTENLSIGEVLVVPSPGFEPNTPTPFPADLQRGTKLEHLIKPGETLADIAAVYLTTVESILKENQAIITDESRLPAGTVIVIRYGLITATPPVPVLPAPTPTP